MCPIIERNQDTMQSLILPATGDSAPAFCFLSHDGVWRGAVLHHAHQTRDHGRQYLADIAEAFNEARDIDPGAEWALVELSVPSTPPKTGGWRTPRRLSKEERATDAKTGGTRVRLFGLPCGWDARYRLKSDLIPHPHALPPGIVARIQSASDAKPLPSGDADGEAFRSAWLKHFPGTDADTIIVLDNVAGLTVRGEDEFACPDPHDPQFSFVVDIADDGKIDISTESRATGKLHLETFSTPDELADYLQEKIEG